MVDIPRPLKKALISVQDALSLSADAQGDIEKRIAAIVDDKSREHAKERLNKVFHSHYYARFTIARHDSDVSHVVRAMLHALAHRYLLYFFLWEEEHDD